MEKKKRDKGIKNPNFKNYNFKLPFNDIGKYSNKFEKKILIISPKNFKNGVDKRDLMTGSLYLKK